MAMATLATARHAWQGARVVVERCAALGPRTTARDRTGDFPQDREGSTPRGQMRWRCGEAFGNAPIPASTFLVVSQLAWPYMAIEIDVMAMLPK